MPPFDDPIAELVRLLKEANLTPCFWFGLAPCPKCKRDHGDPACTKEKDAELRAILRKNSEGPVLPE